LLQTPGDFPEPGDNDPQATIDIYITLDQTFYDYQDLTISGDQQTEPQTIEISGTIVLGTIVDPETGQESDDEYIQNHTGAIYIGLISSDDFNGDDGWNGTFSYGPIFIGNYDGVTPPVYYNYTIDVSPGDYIILAFIDSEVDNGNLDFSSGDTPSEPAGIYPQSNDDLNFYNFSSDTSGYDIYVISPEYMQTDTWKNTTTFSDNTPDLTFDYMYGDDLLSDTGYSYGKFTDVKTDDDGYIYIAGWVSDDNSYWYPVILKLDQKGNVINYYTGDTSYENLSKLKAFIVFYNYQVESIAGFFFKNDSSDYFVCLLDKNLDVFIDRIEAIQ
jgi:hypothetical protein